MRWPGVGADPGPLTFCRQPLYANAMPLMFNATVLNGMGLIGEHTHSTPS